MFQWLRHTLAALFGRRSASPPLLGRLDEERKDEFFAWFNLEERSAPSPGGNGRMRYFFHPAGPAFQQFVTLDLTVARGGEIVGAVLAIDRDFVEDNRNGVFARDIAKSFLTWTLRHEPSGRARPLIDNIASLASSGAPVIMRADAAPPVPPVDDTGGYAVYLGQRAAAEIALEPLRLALRNRANGRRWLILEVLHTQ
jgi:hypothetical protein